MTKLAIVVGMESERDIVGQPPGAVVIVGAGDVASLAAKLEAAIAAGADRVLSVGICGAINLGLAVGDVVVGVNAVYPGTGEAVAVCDPAWCDRLFDALQANPQPYRVSYGRFAWSETAVSRLSDKASLRKATDADCVDEESFISCSIAVARGIPCNILRVVCDPASFELPPAAMTKLTAAGADDMGAIFASIVRDPWEIPELFELWGLSATAMGNLRAVVARVGPGLAWQETR
jgi:adenosylhomocysteine nucleosidase